MSINSFSYCVRMVWDIIGGVGVGGVATVVCFMADLLPHLTFRL